MLEFQATRHYCTTQTATPIITTRTAKHACSRANTAGRKRDYDSLADGCRDDGEIQHRQNVWRMELDSFRA